VIGVGRSLGRRIKIVSAGSSSIWNYLVNVTASGDSGISKTGGVDGTWDAVAGANTLYSATGDIRADFYPSASTSNYFVGLTDLTPAGGTFPNSCNLRYAIYMNGAGLASVFENGGTFIANTAAYTAGTKLTVWRQGNTITYLANDVVFHTSTLSPSGLTLFPAAAFNSTTAANSTLSSATITASAILSMGWDTRTACTTTGGGQLTKTGSAATWDTKARSSSTFAGDCVFSFTVAGRKDFYAGLTTTATWDSGGAFYTLMEYVIELTGTGRIWTYETSLGGSEVARSPINSYNAGDVFQVRRVGNTVSYWHNGVQLYESLFSASGKTLFPGIAVYDPAGAILTSATAV
jgi:hypothetical protein